MNGIYRLPAEKIDVKRCIIPGIMMAQDQYFNDVHHK